MLQSHIKPILLLSLLPTAVALLPGILAGYAIRSRGDAFFVLLPARNCSDREEKEGEEEEEEERITTSQMPDFPEVVGKTCSV